MKRIVPIAVAALALPLLVFSQSPRKGPMVDRLLFDVKTQEEPALKDTAEGRSDLFLSGVPRASIDSLTPDVREKLDLYETPAGRGDPARRC